MDIRRGIRPLDNVLAAAMAALAVVVALANTTAGPGADLAHPLDSQSALMIPVFVLATLPILWRRRGILAAIGISLLIVAASVPAFGWVTRCGFALPLSVAMAYAVARFAGGQQRQLIGLVGILALQVVTLVQDSSTGGLGALAVSVPAAALGYGAGVLVQSRSGRSNERPRHDAEHVHA